VKLPIPKRALAHMDMVRGLAAIAVVLGHVRGLLFHDWRELPAKTAALKVVYFFTGLGHQSVVVFFVLSGFFVGTSVLSSTGAGTWSWRQFLLRRFTRLYVVLIPALLITLAIDAYGMHAFGTAGNIYSGELNAPMIQAEDVRRTIGPATFFGNLFFLQYIFCSPYGSNGPLWSLSYEFWAYMIFPMLVLALDRRAKVARRVAYAVVAAALLVMCGRTMSFYFCIWLFGAGVAWKWARLARAAAWLGSAPARVLALGFFAVALAGARLGLLRSNEIGDVCSGIATATLLVVWLCAGTRAPIEARPAYARLATTLAGFSYTLYLSHFPLIALASAGLTASARWMPDAAHLAIGGAFAVAICALYAYPLSRLTEANTDAVRRRIGRALESMWAGAD
jgi:peptidoglycan/LPS O-acetylase OafA/YrhL